MNLKDKLKGLPTIYYLNLDERPDRKQYTEEQYEKYKISNFKRFSASSYQLQNFDEWKSKVILNDISTCKRWRQHLIEVATAPPLISLLCCLNLFVRSTVAPTYVDLLVDSNK